MWLSLGARWLLLLGAFGVVAYAVYLFGLHGVPALTGMDRALAEAINPDAYVPVLDEFFRGVTDYSNFVIPVPMVSIMVAYGLYRLTQMPLSKALRWSAISCVIYGLFLGLLYWGFGDEEGVPRLILYLAPVAPVLIALGAGVPALFPALGARRWLTGLLTVEVIVMLALWGSKQLWWNEGLPGANFVLLPVLLTTFSAAAWLFYRVEEETMRRFARLIWLVVLSVIITDFIATQRTKSAVGRARPLSEQNAPWNEQMRHIPEELLRGNSSYPSGHTSGTFSLLIPVFWWLRDPRARAGVLAWCVLQGVSRVYTAAHFPLDCLMGALLGVTGGTLVFFLLGGPALRLERKAVAA